ncbi:MAG: hypothetical protein GMKNLPBB_01790 [Myxococcota bacterium]|nr:hypothetical protein [Myxococcota bacterium]
MWFSHLLAAALLLHSIAAEGFVRATTDKDAGYPEQKMYWTSTDIRWKLSKGGYSRMKQEEILDAMTRSFKRWSEAPCHRVNFVYGGLTDERIATFNRKDLESNENSVMFIEKGWNNREYFGAIAITSQYYNAFNGEIVGSDIEFNAEDYTFASSGKLTEFDPTRTPMDLENTAVHEIGHLLGLAHSLTPAATMYGQANPNETIKRDLHIDDILGVCAIYGDDAVLNTPKSGGCSLAPDAGSSHGGGFAALLLAILLARRFLLKSRA